jgi:formylglycine-generating enzyme required for sulfatase activity
VSNQVGVVTSAVAEVKVKPNNTIIESKSSGMPLRWVPGIPGTGEGAYVGRHEVTVGEYRKVMGTVPTNSSQNDNYPVTFVSYNDAIEFCEAMTAADRNNGTLQPSQRYVLPTTKQWTAFAGEQRPEQRPKILRNGVTSIETRERKEPPLTSPSPVESKSNTNQYGLFDIWGNVWELTRDSHRCGCSFTLLTDNPPFTTELFPGNRDRETGFRVMCVQE